MISGVVPVRSTALLPAHRLPIQWNLAPVWYRGGMHRNATGKIEKPALRKKYGAEYLVAQQNRS